MSGGKGIADLAQPAGAPTLALRDWLQQLAANTHACVLIGATGHLELSPAEEDEARRQLEPALPQLLSQATADAEIFLLDGLAPGADLLIAEMAAAQLAGMHRRVRRIGLLPVPPEVLWGDWLMRASRLDAAQIAAMRERFERNLRTCDVIVRLWDAANLDWSALEVRQTQYRRLAAVLCTHCEALIAILRAGHAGQPGGAAELVSWREHSEPIPLEMRGEARRHRSGWRGDDRLLRIDPSAGTPSAAAQGDPWITRAREALRQGNYLNCYDLIAKAEQQGHASTELQYLRLLALANAGSTAAALRRFEDLRTGQQEMNEDWLALEGRLHKDLGLRGGSAALQHFQRAAACYQAAFMRTGGYFSAINAATTLLLGGDTAGARALAGDLLAGLHRFKPRDETDHYYLQATDAEVSLLLGDVERARAALTEANRLLKGNINARSRSLQQLRLICRKLALDERVLEALQLPPILWLPPTRQMPAAALPQMPATASFVYAGITEPRELENAEQVLNCGFRLHAVLAAPPEKMLERWLQAHGAAWTLRLGRLLERADDVSSALGFLDGEDRWCDAYVGATALGLSRLTARRLGCAWLQPGPERWSEAALPDTPGLDPGALALPVHVSGQAARFQRRFAGLIFADFAGFSRLPDIDLPAFSARFMQAIAQSLAPQAQAILFKHTWGDALHLVTISTRSAALCACAIQDCLEQVRGNLPLNLQKLELRLSAHFAPVFSGEDPVEQNPTFFGTQLSFTARIEPVTPPGMIFVTEAFAARIALEAPDDFVLEYAGEIKLAKSYGQSRLFSLRRQQP